MGKPSKERALSDNEANAVGRMMRISPQKLNLVAAMIRGKKVEQAIADLSFSRKGVADDYINPEAAERIGFDGRCMKP